MKNELNNVTFFSRAGVQHRKPAIVCLILLFLFFLSSSCQCHSQSVKNIPIEISYALRSIESYNTNIREAIKLGNYIYVKYSSHDYVFVYKNKQYSSIQCIKNTSKIDFIYFHDFIKSDTITIILKELQFKGVKIPHVITNHSYYGLIVESSSNYLNH